MIVRPQRLAITLPTTPIGVARNANPIRALRGSARTEPMGRYGTRNAINPLSGCLFPSRLVPQKPRSSGSIPPRGVGVIPRVALTPIDANALIPCVCGGQQRRPVHRLMERNLAKDSAAST